MGLRGELNDVGSDSIPLYLLAILATSLSHLRSLLLTFFIRNPLSFQSNTQQEEYSTPVAGFITSAASTTTSFDSTLLSHHRRRNSDAIAELILLSEQLIINRNLSYSHSDQTTSDDEDENDECVVCLTDLSHGDRVRKLPCGHVFHTSCFEQWIQLMNFNCPLCRRSVVVVTAVDARCDDIATDAVVTWPTTTVQI